LKVSVTIASLKRSTLVVIALLSMTVAADVARAQSNQDGSVAIVYTAKSRYIRAATALETTLRLRGLKTVSIQLPAKGGSKERLTAIEKLKRIDPSVVATGGVVATELILAELPDADVVFFMVPNALDTTFLSDASPYLHRVAGVTSDVSPMEQVAWIHSLMPAVSRLTILSGDRTTLTALAIQEAAERHELGIQVMRANRGAFPEAIDALTSSGTGGVLMVPDASVYNSTTVQRLLVWGARKHKSVWAFSENIVRAGATGGIFADAESVGKQTAGVIQRIQEGTETASIGLQYATGSRTAINVGTVRVIDADIDNRHVDANTVRYGDQ
jgi:ABC-type uncharacterized transport system substrate-binding protein